MLAHWTIKSVSAIAYRIRYMAGMGTHHGQRIIFCREHRPLCQYPYQSAGSRGVEEGNETCTLPNGEVVNFYQVIPLYRDEMEYKLENDVDALFEKMEDVSFVVNPTRPDAITGSINIGDKKV